MHQKSISAVAPPRPRSAAGGAYSAPPEPLAGFGGPTSKGREKEGRGGERGEGKEFEVPEISLSNQSNQIKFIC